MSENSASRFITRQQIISEIGRIRFERAVEVKKLTPYKAEGRNCKVRIDRNEYERYLKSLTFNKVR
jgi:hypothetical protein